MGRSLAEWCRRGDHLTCATVEAVCGCSCHGPTTARPGPKPGTVDRAKAARAAKRSHAARRPAVLTRPAIRKEDAECCRSRRDELDRLPIGFCSPECIRRPR